jgi:Response regulator receiver domain
MSSIQRRSPCPYAEKLRALALVQRGRRVALEVSPSYGLPMPFKHNASRRHRIPKQRFRVMNWLAYEAGLRRCGDFTFWVDDAALAGWQAPHLVHDGREALQAAREFRPDAILLDIGLPVMDGYAVCRAFRQDDLLKGAGT